jgi:hypothetical protein
MAPVMTAASNFTSKPASIWETRAALAKLIVAGGVEG